MWNGRALFNMMNFSDSGSDNVSILDRGMETVGFSAQKSIQPDSIDLKEYIFPSSLVYSHKPCNSIFYLPRNLSISISQEIGETHTYSSD